MGAGEVCTVLRDVVQCWWRRELVGHWRSVNVLESLRPKALRSCAFHPLTGVSGHNFNQYCTLVPCLRRSLRPRHKNYWQDDSLKKSRRTLARHKRNTTAYLLCRRCSRCLSAVHTSAGPKLECTKQTKTCPASTKIKHICINLQSRLEAQCTAQREAAAGRTPGTSPPSA